MDGQGERRMGVREERKTGGRAEGGAVSGRNPKMPPDLDCVCVCVLRRPLVVKFQEGEKPAVASTGDVCLRECPVHNDTHKQAWLKVSLVTLDCAREV